jgi:hypothetical protein
LACFLSSLTTTAPPALTIAFNLFLVGDAPMKSRSNIGSGFNLKPLL